MPCTRQYDTNAIFFHTERGSFVDIYGAVRIDTIEGLSLEWYSGWRAGYDAFSLSSTWTRCPLPLDPTGMRVAYFAFDNVARSTVGHALQPRTLRPLRCSQPLNKNVNARSSVAATAASAVAVWSPVNCHRHRAP